jgi:hypothetical protein
VETEASCGCGPTQIWRDGGGEREIRAAREGARGVRKWIYFIHTKLNVDNDGDEETVRTATTTTALQPAHHLPRGAKAIQGVFGRLH